MEDRFANFPRYNQYDPQVPVWCVTPDIDRVIHRFFDTSPFSPSGRYIALTRLPYEDRSPRPGDMAELVLVDVHTGEQKVVAQTYGWDTQLGAQAQWGTSDNELFFNDLDTETWQPFGVRMDPASGERQRLEGTVYMVSPNGKWAISPSLLRMGCTQLGYGVIVPPEHVPKNSGAPDDDGLYLTNTETGKAELLISLRQAIERAEPRIDMDEFAGGDFYGWHVKWSPAGDRLAWLVRWIPHGWVDQGHGKGRQGRRVSFMTMKADGSDVHYAFSFSRMDLPGHHVNWCPDSEHVMMNLTVEGTMRLVTARYDGTDFRTMSDTIVGSGHPAIHPNYRHIVTDTYQTEPMAFGDGTTPIRFIDLETDTERDLLRIMTEPPFQGPKRELRLDPHPAWDYSHSFVALNACPDGTRRVYVADLRRELS